MIEVKKKKDDTSAKKSENKDNDSDDGNQDDEESDQNDDNDNDEDDSPKYTFKCGNVCSKTLKCGNHQCTLYCHSGACIRCSREVRVPPICACGKTRYKKGSKPYNNPRKSCLDRLPTCNNKCNKLLSCNKHFCQSKCHDSKCKDCKIKIARKCRCGSETKTYNCSVYEKRTQTALSSADNEEILLNPDSWIRCKQSCKKILSCGHHVCRVQCCPGKNQARYPGHLCQQICGRKLNCGKHTCESRCHDGPCNPCGVTYHQGIQCACGAVYEPGPFRCGTRQVRNCTNHCSKTLPCGHDCPKLCHHGPCPTKCSALMTKYCETHGFAIYNMRCFTKNVSCGEQCGKLLSCKKHFCKRKCHSGPCESNEQLSKGCIQNCNQILPCKHKCPKRCHVKQGIPCNPKVCKVKIPVQCQCGNRTELQHCKGRTLMEIKAVSCNEQCVVEDRNRRFRDAFGITPSDPNAGNNNNNSNNGSGGNNNSPGKKGKGKQRSNNNNNNNNNNSGTNNAEEKKEQSSSNNSSPSKKVVTIRVPYAHTVLSRIVEFMSNERNCERMTYNKYKERLKNIENNTSGGEVIKLGKSKDSGIKENNNTDNIKIIVPTFVEYIENVLQCFIDDNSDDLKEFSKKYSSLIDETSGNSLIITDCNSEKRFILYSMLSEYHLKSEQITIKTSKNSNKNKHPNDKSDAINGITNSGGKNKPQKIGILISKHKNYASVPQFLLSKALVLYQLHGMNNNKHGKGKGKKNKKSKSGKKNNDNETKLLTLESIASEKCMIIVDNICNSRAMKSFLVQEELSKFRGDYRMWRSQKTEFFNKATQLLEKKQSMYLVFTVCVVL